MDTCESPIEEIIIDYLPERDEHEGDLHSCPICSRRFRSDVYQKHVVICEKTAAKKRKTFDSSRQRREGTDMALYLPKNFGLPEHKIQHVETKIIPIVKDLNQTVLVKQKIEPTKEVTPFKRGGDQLSIRQSKRNIQPVSEQCPHCDRCFGVKAFDRHVEWCEKKSRLIIHSTPKSVNVAKEKLEARTKYKPPSLKSKRDLNREKYSGEMSCGTSMNSILSDLSIGKRSKSNSIERERKLSVASMTSSITSDSQDDVAGGDALMRYNEERNDILLSDLHIDLGFDKDESDNKFDCDESNSDQNQKEKNSKEKPCKLDSSHYVVQETISSLKMKSQFQISKKEFFARIGKTKPKTSSSQSRISNVASSTDKAIHQSSKIVSNASCPYASVRMTDGNRTGSEMVIGKKNFDVAKKSNPLNSISNTELIVNSYGFHNQSESDKLAADKKILEDDRPLTDTVGKGTGAFKKLREPIKLTQRTSSPCNIYEPRSHKVFNSKQYSFRDSKMQLVQASESDEDSELPKKQETVFSALLKKSTNKAISNRDEGSLVEIYTPRSVKCYNIFNESTKDDKDSANMLMEMKFSPRSKVDSISPKLKIDSISPQSKIDSLSPQSKMNFTIKSHDNVAYKSRMKNLIGRTVCLQSDKYDPFISAKRQLEELFSPTYPNSSSTPITNKTNTMSKSLTLKSPLNTSNSITPIKSAFRRTSSLRMPKKTPKPLLYIPTYKPTTTIQRGISDEGPISSNFLKPEEYDELPVKGHANITPPDIIPRSLSRSSSRSRESSPVVVIKRDQNSNINRRNLRLDINKPNAPSDYPLAKTDSLAVFLKYENDLSCSPGLTEKERKDQSNSLNKQTTLKNSFAELLESKIDRGSVSPQEPIFASKKYSSIKLEPLDHSFIERTNDPKATQNTDYAHSFIDPDLINDCDNLSVSRVIDLPKTKSSSDLIDTIVNTKSSDSVNRDQILNQRNSTEKRTLKRSLKLNKENFLYDTSPVSGKDPASQIKDFNHKQNEMISSPPLRTSESFNKLRNNDCIDALFDDFDFDEFLSSFEDDEQFPIFKGYKELISNRSMNKLNKSDSSSASSTTSVEKSEHNSEEISSPTVCDNDDLMPLPKTNPHPICVYPLSMKSRNNEAIMVDSETQVTHREPIISHENLTRNEDASCSEGVNRRYDVVRNDYENHRDDLTRHKDITQHEDVTQHENVTQRQGVNQREDVNRNEDINRTEDINRSEDGNRRDDANRLDDVNRRNDVNRRDDVNRREVGNHREAVNRREVLENSISQAEKDLLQSVQELDLMCASNAPTNIDYDRRLSIDRNDKVRKCIDINAEADSAYGSLSKHSQFERADREHSYRQRQHVFAIPDIVTSKRKPYQTASTDNTTKRQLSLSLSSSGSESSLPPIRSRKSHEVHSKNEYNMETTGKNQEIENWCKKETTTRLSKFCHSCGSRFTFEQAKFCMECGVKRIVLE